MTATRTESNVAANVDATATFAVNPTLPTTTKLGGGSSVKVNKILKITGTVTAGAPGTVLITMTRLIGKKYKSAGTARVGLAANGAFSYNFKPKYKGTWHLTAAYSGGATSDAFYAISKTATAKTVKVK